MRRNKCRLTLSHSSLHIPVFPPLEVHHPLRPRRALSLRGSRPAYQIDGDFSPRAAASANRLGAEKALERPHAGRLVEDLA